MTKTTDGGCHHSRRLYYTHARNTNHNNVKYRYEKVVTIKKPVDTAPNLCYEDTSLANPGWVSPTTRT